MNKVKEECFLTEEEIEVVTEEYYQTKVKHDKKVEEDRIKQLLKADKKEEKRILGYEELEAFSITEEEEASFREEILKVEEEILKYGKGFSKICYKGIRIADSLTELYQVHYLFEQEETKEDFYKIIHYFNDLKKFFSQRSKQWREQSSQGVNNGKRFK